MLALTAVIFLIFGIEFSLFKSAKAYSCVRPLNNTCSCETDADGWVLDLSPLDYVAHGRQPLSVNGYSSNPNIVYRYNPCTPFRGCGDSDVADVAICQEDSGNKQRIGQQSRANFVANGNSIIIKYPNRGGALDLESESFIFLECDRWETSGRLQLVWSLLNPPIPTQPPSVALRLYTKYACAPPATGTSTTTSTRTQQPTTTTRSLEITPMSTICGVLHIYPSIVWGIIGLIFTIALPVLIIGVMICCMCYKRKSVGIDAQNGIGVRAGHLSSASTARYGFPNRRGESTAHPKPEVFVPRGTRPVRPVNPPPVGFFITPACVPGGAARTQQDMTPPSYDTVIQMKEFETRQTDRY